MKEIGEMINEVKKSRSNVNITECDADDDSDYDYHVSDDLTQNNDCVNNNVSEISRNHNNAVATTSMNITNDYHSNKSEHQFASQYELSVRYSSEILSFPDLKRQISHSNNRYQDMIPMVHFTISTSDTSSYRLFRECLAKGMGNLIS
jgi:hypothetical protein